MTIDDELGRLGLPDAPVDVEAGWAQVRERARQRARRRRQGGTAALVVLALLVVAGGVAMVGDDQEQLETDGRVATEPTDEPTTTEPVATPPTTAGTTTTEQPAGPIETRVVTVTVFVDGAPRPGLQVVHATTGSCWVSSADSARPGAYRCSLDVAAEDGATLEDPCFADESGTAAYLLCLRTPADDRAVQVDPTGGLEPAVPDPDGLPWALDLTNGERCDLITGATLAMGDRRLSYGCPGGDVWGDLDRTGGAQWTVQYQATGQDGMVTVGVAVAYR